MAKMEDKTFDCTLATCDCGGAALECRGKQIMSALCYCDDCQKAGEELESLEDATPIVDDDGGTYFVLYRADRVRPVRGDEYLKEHRLHPDSKTRRVVATCCNTAMFLDFTAAHWLTVYGDRIPEQKRPVPDMRVMLKCRKGTQGFADNIPGHATHSPRFFFKLLSAWAMMGFKIPKVTYIHGSLDIKESHESE